MGEDRDAQEGKPDNAESYHHRAKSMQGRVCVPSRDRRVGNDVTTVIIRTGKAKGLLSAECAFDVHRRPPYPHLSSIIKSGRRQDQT